MAARLGRRAGPEPRPAAPAAASGEHRERCSHRPRTHSHPTGRGSPRPSFGRYGEAGSWLVIKDGEVPDAVESGVVHGVRDRPAMRTLRRARHVVIPVTT